MCVWVLWWTDHTSRVLRRWDQRQSARMNERMKSPENLSMKIHRSSFSGHMIALQSEKSRRWSCERNQWSRFRIEVNYGVMNGSQTPERRARVRLPLSQTRQITLEKERLRLNTVHLNELLLVSAYMTIKSMSGCVMWSAVPGPARLLCSAGGPAVCGDTFLGRVSVRSSLDPAASVYPSLTHTQIRHVNQHAIHDPWEPWTNQLLQSTLMPQLFFF